MNVLPRTEIGDPLLRKKARRIPKAYLRSQAFKDLCRSMVYTMRRSGGVGLAAPQIGFPYALISMEMRPTRSRPSAKGKKPLIVINPKITSFSKERTSDWEGCLSVPGLRGKVPRARKITVEYMTAEGEKVTENTSGLWARIFQHEIDHLNGILFVDRIEDTRTLMTVREFRERVLEKRKKRKV